MSKCLPLFLPERTFVWFSTPNFRFADPMLRNVRRTNAALPQAARRQSAPPFIAWDLVQAVESAGGVVIGPAATVAQALALVQASGLEAAILDVNLPEGHIGPVLESLPQRVAVIIHSGVGLPPDVWERFPSVPLYFKPTPTGVLTRRLAFTLRGQA